MRRSKFIESTRLLIEQGVFGGENAHLRRSLQEICRVLSFEGDQYIVGNLIALNDHTVAAESEYRLSAYNAWTWLFKNIGRQSNTVYKRRYRTALEVEFALHSAHYSDDIKELWRDVFADNEGPLDSRFDKLENFIDELEKQSDFPLVNELILVTNELKSDILYKNNGRQSWFTVNDESKSNKLNAVRMYLLSLDAEITPRDRIIILTLIRDICAVKRNPLGLFKPHSLDKFSIMYQSISTHHEKFPSQDVKNLNDANIDAIIARFKTRDYPEGVTLQQPA